MEVSFGRKIPRQTCQIQKKETGEYVRATFYEIDCREEKDAIEIRNLDRKWNFRNDIAQNMMIKNSVLTYLNQKSNLDFYAMQDSNGELVGLAQVKTINGVSNISYITTKPHNEYKYVGQTMVAAIGKETLKKGGSALTIATAIDEAMDFYTKKCGFKKHGKYMLRMNREQIEKSVQKAETKTKSRIIDLKG